MEKETILSEVENYVNAVFNGKSVGMPKPKFYIVCPCSGTQDPQAPTLGVEIKGNPSNSNERRPFDTPTFFDLVRVLQKVDLMPAYKLYIGNGTPYLEVHKNNPNRAYFLSPAWGIVRSSFCLPQYDVSFSGTQEDEDPEAYVEIDSNGEYTDGEWKSGMQYAFNQLKDDIDKFGNHNIPIVLMMGKEYFWRFKYLYINSKMQNPLLVIAGNSDVVRDCVSLNWRFCRPPHNGNTWYYEYMKKI